MTSMRAGRSALDIVIPEMTNTTFDNGDATARQIYEMYNRRIFDGRFATVRPMADVLRELTGGTSATASTVPASSEAPNREYR